MGDQDAGNQRVVLGVAGFVTAAAVLGIAYLLASDVRGRAAATAETIRARAAVADTVLRMADSAHARKPATPAGPADSGLRFAALSSSLSVRHHAKAGSEERGWRAIAVLTNGDQTTRYLVVNGTKSEWVDAGTLEF